MKSLKQPLLAEHPTFDPSKVWVLMWSQQQGMLHTETLAEMLRSNLRAFIANLSMDFVPLFIGSDDACRAAAYRVRANMDRLAAAGRAGVIGRMD